MNVLVVGAEGSGKSLFLKRLQYLYTYGKQKRFEDTPSTIPTVGNNLTKINIEKVDVELREVGGAVAPIWKRYYNDSNCIIFVVDRSNQFQYSASCMLLLTCLSNVNNENKSVLILFNKTDFSCEITMPQLRNIFRINDIVHSAKQAIDIVECSCMDKTGFEEIIAWLDNVVQSHIEKEILKK